MSDEPDDEDTPVFRIDEIMKLLNDLVEVMDTLHCELSDLKEEIKEMKIVIDEIKAQNEGDSSSNKNFMHG